MSGDRNVLQVLVGHLLTGGCVQVEPLGVRTKRPCFSASQDSTETGTVRGDIVHAMLTLSESSTAAGGERVDDGSMLQFS